jgi:hypothetical protein
LLSSIIPLDILSNGIRESIVKSTIQKKNLVLNLVTANSKKLVQVSFNGDEGMHGTLKIFNSLNEKVGEFNLELIAFPNYATVDITSLSTGKYKAELSTRTAIHTSDLIIK